MLPEVGGTKESVGFCYFKQFKQRWLMTYGMLKLAAVHKNEPQKQKFYSKMLHASTNGVMDWSRFQR